MLQEGLGMPHVRPEVVVGGELCLMFGRFGAFQGEVVAQVCSSAVKPVKLEPGQDSLIAAIVSTRDDGQGFLLSQLNLPALVLGKAAMEDRGSKLKHIYKI